MSSPEQVLQFGTGMLLRAICAAAVDTANRAGAYDGRIVVVQNTPGGVAAQVNRLHGTFVLAERGLVHGVPVQKESTIRSISRALIAATQWPAIREVIVRPELRVVVSNVTEAGFRLDDAEPMPEAFDPASASFPAKLTDLLHGRFVALPGAPILWVIPTELVPDNGPQLAAMVDTLAQRYADAAPFRAWIGGRVRFCSSLVDRITTHSDPETLATVTEPHSLWAIECDPAGLRDAFPVDECSGGAVVFAPDITMYRERKLRLLNGAHTALAPLALRAGVRTVREAMADAVLGPFLRQVLEEIGPSTDLQADAAQSYADSVIERFSNPWLEHEWSVIATNQTAKLRLRVIPSIVAFQGRFGRVPPHLVRALAASLRYARAVSRSGPATAEGWWGGRPYRIVDVDFDLIDRHWHEADPAPRAAAIPPGTMARFAAAVLGDTAIWGQDLGHLCDAVTSALVAIE